MVNLLVSELRRFQNARCNYKNDYTVFDPKNCVISN